MHQVSTPDKMQAALFMHTEERSRDGRVQSRRWQQVQLRSFRFPFIAASAMAAHQAAPQCPAGRDLGPSR